ncbi:hypothetical protein ACTJJ0_13895 [Chitinophaga sp. 22321]|uniref:Uncharacterized protein n=1 Tax=Chitinophaga hostae TaxID=2831022 RepID=A0ABS5J1D7_9BACT|nr:hypothetical protein [Chitinophaga hostae]MBS0029036.1 hypothetical protein [Chitinophaga hostae]
MKNHQIIKISLILGKTISLYGIKVGRHFFEDTPENKTVAVYLKPGLLNIPWYEVGETVNINPPQGTTPR